MISLTLSPLARVLALTEPFPVSASQPCAFDLANISSHHGKSRSRAMSRNQGVNELATSQRGSYVKSVDEMLTVVRKHLLEFLPGNVFRIRHLVQVELGINVDSREEDVVD